MSRDPPVRVVLVEDNLQLAGTIADGLAEDGYTVDVVDTAAKASSAGCAAIST